MQIPTALRGATALALLNLGAAQAGTLVIESWRVDDKTLWETVLIPAFEKKHPGIQVKFSPTAPTEYDSSLAARLAGGTAGDLMACRPFDVSLSLFKKGHLEKLDGKPGMENFPPSATVAWQTDDGKDTFCMPMAAVIHGFLYNKKIFKKLNLQPPKTEAEFFAVLDAVKKDGSAAPLALGTADQWEANADRLHQHRPQLLGRVKKAARRWWPAPRPDSPTRPTWRPSNSWRRLGGLPAQGRQRADLRRQPEPVLARPRGGVSGGFMGHRVLQPDAGRPGVRCLCAAGEARPATSASSPTTPTSGWASTASRKNKEDAQKFIDLARARRSSPTLYTNKVTGFFSLSNHLIAVKRPGGQADDGLAQPVRVSTIRLNSPGAQPRHAADGERTVERGRAGAQRQARAEGRGRAHPGRQRQAVQAAAPR